MEFSDRLTVLLKENGITAKGLTEKLNIGSTSVTDWKRGKSSPSPKTLIGISQILGVSIDYLLTGNETEKSPALSMSEDEVKVLKYYGRLSEEQRDYIKGEMVRLYATNNEGEVSDVTRMVP